LSRNEGVVGEGGLAGVEARWLEEVDEDEREGYRKCKGSSALCFCTKGLARLIDSHARTHTHAHTPDWQAQYPPSSVSTDITLSQFLSIQEKGVSAWCFEPDYESNPSLYVESRTEITFLSDGPGMARRDGGGNTVLANLPVPKLNEVYYWEAKMYEKPSSTEVVVGLATKPFPSFRMPGNARTSMGYQSGDGFRCHNYPFTASSYGPPLAEGDVLGVGYRPRQGTVFFTRNGKKLEDCYTGLNGSNLFPAVGANGAATVHINLGQAGFVFIEANVKKWGLAPMMGTLAPPPAYGSERGSILLDAGYGVSGARTITPDVLDAARRVIDENIQQRQQRSRPQDSEVRVQGMDVGTRPIGPGHRRGFSQPVGPSPLREGSFGPFSRTGEGSSLNPGRRLGEGARYRSPTDREVGLNRAFPDASLLEEGRAERDPARTEGETEWTDVEDETSSTASSSNLNLTVGARRPSSPGGSPLPHNPPTPNMLDISLHSFHGHQTSDRFFGGRANAESGESGSSDDTVRQGDEAARTERRRQRREARRRAQLDSAGQDGLQARLNALVSSVMRPGNGDVPPPGYAPLDPYRESAWPGSVGFVARLAETSSNGRAFSTGYADGVPTDLPAEIISQAFEE
jgi:hypothetical protein